MTRHIYIYIHTYSSHKERRQSEIRAPPSCLEMSPLHPPPSPNGATKDILAQPDGQFLNHKGPWLVSLRPAPFSDTRCGTSRQLLRERFSGLEPIFSDPLLRWAPMTRLHQAELQVSAKDATKQSTVQLNGYVFLIVAFAGCFNGKPTGKPKMHFEKNGLRF